MVTHAYPLDQYRDALRAAANHRKSGAVKVVLQP
jgi:threonine dehydrogenase-like Zn-dependent dehydrogenase